MMAPQQKFNLWTVLAAALPRKGRKYWLCVCECGTFREVKEENLKRNHTKSCGCQKMQAIKCKNTTHGLTDSYKYVAWLGIKARCDNPNNPAYSDYGGRGIKLCSEWYDFATFARDIGDRPSARHTVDRVDNSLGYAPNNFRWATKVEQMYNTRRTRHYVYQGKTVTIQDMLKLTTVSAQNLRSRLNVLNYTVDEALVP